MESMLLERIADLRMSEADFSRSIYSVRNNGSEVDLNEKYVRMHAQLDEVEKLVASMEAIEMNAPLAAVTAPTNTRLLAA